MPTGATVTGNHLSDLAFLARSSTLTCLRPRWPVFPRSFLSAPGELVLGQRIQPSTASPPCSATPTNGGATSDWSDLLRRPQEPELDLEGDEGLLEAATPETYLAVSRYDLPPARP
ncbi:hypothetical protein GCM10018777_11880 [Streptomyces albogriseolus]|nr:hypothetical protein GCM10018777_11880 [Streptomyces viridodiastaticus]